MEFGATITAIANSLRTLGLGLLLDERVLLPAERLQFVKLIRENSNSPRYKELESAGLQIQGKRHQMLKRIDTAQKRIAGLEPHLNALNEFVRKNKKRLVNHPEWAKTSEFILQKASEEKLDQESVTRFLQQVGSTTMTTMRNDLEKTIDSINLRLNRYRTDLLASLVGAAIAQIVGESGSLTPAFTVQTDEVEQAANLVMEEVWNQEQRLATALAAEDPILAREAALDLSAGLAHHKKTLLVYACALHNVQETERTQHHTDALIRLGEVMINLVRSLALGSYVASFSLGGKDNPTFKRWSKQAKKLTILQPERVIGLLPSELLQKQMPGELVSVRGVVEKEVTFTWRLSSGRIKKMQFLTVADKDGSEISVAVPYFNLFAAGGGLGTPIRVTGVWSEDVIGAHVRSPTLSEKETLKSFPSAGIDVDRINLGMEAKTSWWHWATNELRIIYDTFPNSLNVSWGWDSKGAANLLSHGLWSKRS